MKKALHESLLPARHIIRIGWEAEKKERRGGRPFRACVATYIHRLGKGMRTLKAEKEKKEEEKKEKKTKTGKGSRSSNTTRMEMHQTWSLRVGHRHLWTPEKKGRIHTHI